MQNTQSSHRAKFLHQKYLKTTVSPNGALTPPLKTPHLDPVPNPPLVHPIRTPSLRRAQTSHARGPIPPEKDTHTPWTPRQVRACAHRPAVIYTHTDALSRSAGRARAYSERSTPQSRRVRGASARASEPCSTVVPWRGARVRALAPIIHAARRLRSPVVRASVCAQCGKTRFYTYTADRRQRRVVRPRGMTATTTTRMTMTAEAAPRGRP